jgi:hypothetical protein
MRQINADERDLMRHPRLSATSADGLSISRSRLNELVKDGFTSANQSHKSFWGAFFQKGAFFNF